MSRHASKSNPGLTNEIGYSSPVDGVKIAKKGKLILAFTTVYGHLFDITKIGRSKVEKRRLSNPLNACKYRCRWSTDRADYNRSDAVVFHMYNNLNNKDFVIRNLPIRTNLDQKWVLMIREPQAFYYPKQLRLLNNSFNLTMTFQTDSDIHIPYGRYWKLNQKQITKRNESQQSYSQGRDKMAFWLVSNCVTSSRREKYVQELQKYISIDVYGECSRRRNLENGSTREQFRNKLAAQYKFYIAFENSDCDDYITEKFWRTLKLGVIPIVRGHRAQYKKYAPPNSYIHADSFLTSKKLAQYMIKVASNATLFNKYHEWRRVYDADHKILTINRHWLCDLCERVHVSERKTVNVYEHFSEDTRCFTYEDQDGRNRTSEHMEDLDRV